MRAELNPNVTISGTGAYLPERVIDNDTLSGMVSGFDTERGGDFGAWVDQVTHVHERRFCDWSVRSNDLALPAARQALEVAGLEPQDIGLIVYASFTVSQDLPGDHCLFAEQLGATSTPVFHLKAACAGSVYGLSVAYAMVASGVYEHVLVVGTETASKALNFHDPITSIIFGDGSGAAVVSRREGGAGGGMLPAHLGFRYSPRNIHLGNSNIPVDVTRFPDRQVEPGVPLVEQALVEMESGPNVLRSAVLAMAECVTSCLGYDKRDLRRKDPALLETIQNARIVPHQANGRIIDGLADRLRAPHERTVRTIYRYGNMSAASNLVALDYGLRRGNMARRLDDEGLVLEIVDQPEQRFESGELVLLPSIGGGYLMGCAAFIAEPTLVERTRAQEEALAAAR
ncbi:MAG: ketoacyl-ACP synthase III [Planctomycetota bacterium]|nr:ketoacyl-ACP synthase III [Planctomycetota bacterium]